MGIRKGLDTAARAVKVARIAKAARKVARTEGDDRETAKRALAALMADARGVPMKVGQFLASKPDSEAFDVLVQGIPARPLAEMLPVLEAELARPVSEVFASVEESDAAASLGQVHRARLLDGTEVAIKLQYPDIAPAVEAELRLAGLMPGVGPAKQWGFDLDAYKAALKDNMDRELDYRSESARQQAFLDKVQVPGLVVPRVHQDLCTQRMLVQSWESGASLEAAANWPADDRRRVGEILMATFLKSLFVAGQVHCDPNLGNLFVRRNARNEPEVVLLDYGCMVDVKREVRLALLKMILGCRSNDETDALACFVEMGFDAKKLVPIAATLPALCAIMFEPFLRSDPYSHKYWDLGQRMTAMLGELRWWFRSAGPAQQFLLMRAFSGMVAHLETLQIMVSWGRVLDEAAGPETATAARAFTPKPIDLSLERTATNFQSVAQFLRVQVMEGSKQIVKVSMPATQVSDLGELIPEDVGAKIRDAGIDVTTIARKACESGIIPQDLFSFDAGTRQYRVWLE